MTEPAVVDVTLHALMAALTL